MVVIETFSSISQLNPGDPSLTLRMTDTYVAIDRKEVAIRK